MPEAGAIQVLGLPMMDGGDAVGIQALAVKGNQPPSSSLPAEVSEMKSEMVKTFIMSERLPPVPSNLMTRNVTMTSNLTLQ